MNFKVYQMNTKIVFSNGELEEKVFVEQYLDFEDAKYLDFMYSLFIALS